MMKRALLVGVAGLAACLPPRSSPDHIYRASAAATTVSLQCSHDAARELGYSVRREMGGSAGTLNAERVFDEGGQRSRGYITVSVSAEQEWVMRVTAERISEGARIPGTAPSPTPFPPPTPVPVSRRTAHERVDPGSVASDARRVLRRCAVGAIAENNA